MKITFEIPLKTPSLNQWYSGGHWSKRKKVADEWHDAVWAVMREKKIKPITDFPISVTYRFYMKRLLDPSNTITAPKLIEDGLVKAGIIPDDTARYIGRIVLDAPEKGNDRVVVTIDTLIK